MLYCEDLFNFNRVKTSKTKIGEIAVGAGSPIAVQSMTNTSTMDTKGSVNQCIKIFDNGADIVRLTAQGVREAKNLENIKNALVNKGYTKPLVADIHFNANAADISALYVDKVRINPGNFVTIPRMDKSKGYTQEEYAEELRRIKIRLIKFIAICKKNGRAIRIGVNHGSLSERIMNRYGDTPRGMVESCMEFLRICVDQNFSDIVISIKSSITRVMIETVRLLSVAMQKENMCFPLHLGVTEAGEGEDGRIKAACGVGSLMLDGLGDTIRISLTEPPENEVPVGKLLLDLINKRTKSSKKINCDIASNFDPYNYSRMKTLSVGVIGGENPPVVISCIDQYSSADFSEKPDFVYSCFKDEMLDFKTNKKYSVYNSLDNCRDKKEDYIFLKSQYSDISDEFISKLKEVTNCVLLFFSNSIYEQRVLFHKMLDLDCKIPVILSSKGDYSSLEEAQMQLSLDFAPAIIDGFGDGLLYLPNDVKKISLDDISRVLFGILQATRTRITKTEYVSCPGCGRTLYDIQAAVAQIKDATKGLKNLKIGIMGCIVNGLGEMGDVDYGYVGAGRGKVSLYKKKECVVKNIPIKDALSQFIKLIKDNGDWNPE